MTTKFKYEKIYGDKNYLIDFCEKIFSEKNFKEDTTFKDFPERFAYETEIWMIGEDIRQNIIKIKKEELKIELFEAITSVINKTKYKKGRESFVMLLHYFIVFPNIEKYIGNILEDKYLYGFAIHELIKIKKYNTYKDKVQTILDNEKTAWIKNYARKYIEYSS